MKTNKLSVILFVLAFLFVFFVGYQLGIRNTPQKAIMDRVRSLYDKGEKDKAIKELELGARELQLIIDKVEMDAYRGKIYKEEARHYFFRDMYQKALEYASKASSIFPNDPILYFIAGASMYQLSKTSSTSESYQYKESAKENLKTAIKLNKDYLDARYIYALIMVEENNYQEALENVNYVLRIEPKNIEFLFLRARIYYELGRLLEARDDYSKLLEILPENSTRKRKVIENIKIIDQQIREY